METTGQMASIGREETQGKRVAGSEAASDNQLPRTRDISGRGQRKQEVQVNCIQCNSFNVQAQNSSHKSLQKSTSPSMLFMLVLRTSTSGPSRQLSISFNPVGEGVKAEASSNS